MVHGEGGASSADSPFDIDREHAALAERCKLPNLPEAEPELLRLPEPVQAAVLDWALRPD
jgi:hypothetical protein